MAASSNAALSIDDQIEQILRKQNQQEEQLTKKHKQQEELVDEDNADKILEYSEQILKQYLGQEGVDLYENKAHITLKRKG